ncbi:aspartate/glutamate racemase family protein [Microbacterium sp. 18062]|uniref:aspartate/glutamate racemase family protein n=1 Tax=Microbacterium sp. 18062 TaxID=2681410 RepID=UPI001356D0AC|nr:aspartate/glutamate racemase family protein [Microbacterium sp. 18062]
MTHPTGSAIPPERTVIGVLGGIGPQASARLHRVLVDRATLAVAEGRADVFPEIVHFSTRVGHFTEPGPDRAAAVDALTRATRVLVDSGAVVIGLVCNTAHLLLPAVEAATDAKVERIPEHVAEVVVRDGYRRVGLLATQSTLDLGLYDPVGVVTELIAASRALTAEVSEHIVDVYTGRETPARQQEFRDLVARFRDEERLDAVILGCTELPVAFGDADRAGVVDSIDVLSDGLLARFHALASSRPGAVLARTAS